MMSPCEFTYSSLIIRYVISCGKKYINFCVPSTFIISEVETSRIVYNRNPDPDSTTQNELFFFFLVILSYNIRPKVITKNKSAECFLSQAQNIIKIWKFTIQKKVKENLKFYSQNRETRVSDATVPVSFFFFKFWCWFVNIFPFFVFFFLMISLGLFMSWLVEFIWFVHDYCSILIICNTAYQ